MRLHSISAGDVVRALRLLDARDEETRTAIARVLGFELEGSVRSPAVGRPIRDEGKAALQPEPEVHLFNPQWARAMISTMARIRTRSGPPEIESLVAAAAERQPMLALARSITETASGADVLVDVRESMAMFSREQARLVNMMRRVLGRGMVSTFQFQGSPLREGYRPARPGWPVVVLTDLGIGAGAAAANSGEWLEFSRQVRARGCHPFALVPYSRARWPVEVAASIHIIEWSRATSVRTIKAALRAKDFRR